MTESLATPHTGPMTGRNPDLARAMVEKRRSNAASKHQDRRTKRLRSRAAKRRAAIREQRA